ncbi:DUF952 domain-containing protein [Micromonospora sp. NPDC049891]|uniref:DUF952 domain-containing protein n=1 Tax=Micromonospora sp. NPDC049891 TaxID=3155655 RepID=UPI0033FB33EA
MLIYKILLPGEWADFQAAGRFDGSPFDRNSGFIHCSSRSQLPATAARVFGDQPRLVVVALDTSLLGGALRWEDAPNGGPFPHVYAALPATAVVGVYPVDGATRVDDEVPTA